MISSPRHPSVGSSSAKHTEDQQQTPGVSGAVFGEKHVIHTVWLQARQSFQREVQGGAMTEAPVVCRCGDETCLMCLERGENAEEAPQS